MKSLDWACGIFLRREKLGSRIQRFPFAKHSEKLAISIRAPFFECSVFYHQVRETFLKARDLYSRVFLCAQCFLFARHSEKLAISIRAPFFERCVLFFLGVSNGTYQLYFFTSPCHCGWGRALFRFKKTFCLMNMWSQDLLSHEPTLWFRRHQLFGLGAPSF